MIIWFLMKLSASVFNFLYCSCVFCKADELFTEYESKLFMHR